MNSYVKELDILRELTPELEAQGYEVHLHPGRGIVPGFLKDYQPDAIAIRSDKKLVIEVVGQGERTTKKIEMLANLMKGAEGWELRVEYVPQRGSGEELEIQTPEQIAASISDVRELAAGRFSGAALLLAWATFEALARALLIEDFRRPQTPGRLISVLAEKGYVTPTEADALEGLAKTRNKLVHGHLHVVVEESELSKFVKILETLESLGEGR